MRCAPWPQDRFHNVRFHAVDVLGHFAVVKRERAYQCLVQKIFVILVRGLDPVDAGLLLSIQLVQILTLASHSSGISERTFSLALTSSPRLVSWVEPAFMEWG